jgi:hypothetical protein
MRRRRRRRRRRQKKKRGINIISIVKWRRKKR